MFQLIEFIHTVKSTCLSRSDFSLYLGEDKLKTDIFCIFKLLRFRKYLIDFVASDMLLIIVSINTLGTPSFVRHSKRCCKCYTRTRKIPSIQAGGMTLLFCCNQFCLLFSSCIYDSCYA
jgi:hypothetical protein